jgi:hypothetical protein
MLVVLMMSLLGFVVPADARRLPCSERETSVKAAITLTSRSNHEHVLASGTYPRMKVSARETCRSVRPWPP